MRKRRQQLKTCQRTEINTQWKNHPLKFWNQITLNRTTLMNRRTLTSRTTLMNQRTLLRRKLLWIVLMSVDDLSELDSYLQSLKIFGYRIAHNGCRRIAALYSVLEFKCFKLALVFINVS